MKIRGFRIELGEIEAALLEHPSVQRAVVVAREDTPGDKRLCAYVVASDAAGDLKDQLRSHLAAKLPEHMVPSAFVVLAAIPLLSSGKIDRRALPAPEAGHAAEGAFVTARTPEEEVLAGIWADVLGLDRVSVEADFFALGGHSLLGMRVLARLGLAFGVELPVRALFEARSVARLAERVVAARSGGEHAVTAPLVRVPRDASGGAVPLSFAQQRLWFLDQLEPNSPLYNIPAALRLEGPLDVGALERSFGRDRPPSRGAADDVRDGERGAAAGHRAGGLVLAAVGRPVCAGRGGARGGGAAARRRGGGSVPSSCRGARCSG